VTDPLLDVEDLTVRYETDEGALTAASNVSFSISEGEYFGVVGESGCGKSTLAKAISGGLSNNGRIASGSIRYKGEEIQEYSENQLNKEIRWKEISVIPQSSMNNLDPLETIADQAVTLAKTHTEMTRSEALETFEELLDVVGVSPQRVNDYPHQFSGGMEQRVVIALALFLEPNLIIADEPTTALDVIMQDQVMRYVDDIKRDTDTAMMFITHDISVLFETCDTLSVMHGGQMVETGTVEALYDVPRHPYSIMLQNSFPDIRQPGKSLSPIGGKPPQNYGDIDYCTYANRCPLAIEECRESAPQMESINVESDGTSDHRVACFRHEDASELRGGESES
jgi:oligopeptide/dipeptide ABC transporter ATP-binding protein